MFNPDALVSLSKCCKAFPVPAWSTLPRSDPRNLETQWQTAKVCPLCGNRCEVITCLDSGYMLKSDTPKI